MRNSVWAPALLALVIALVISSALIVAHRGGNKRRGWFVGGGLTALLLTIGIIDLMRETPRETHIASVILAVTLPVIGTIGAIRGTHRLRRGWLRWPIVFATTFLLFFVGLLIGATVLPRFLP
jgi:hypothetical protein